MFAFGLVMAMIANDPLVVGPLHLGESIAAASRSLGDAVATKNPCKPGYACSATTRYREGSKLLTLEFEDGRLYGIRLDAHAPSTSGAFPFRVGVASLASWKWMGKALLALPSSDVPGFSKKALADGGRLFRKPSAGLEASFEPGNAVDTFLLGQE